VREQPGRFDNDDGSPDLAIRTAQTPEKLLDALRAGRVLVAIVATADETNETTGADKSSHMSVVSMLSADGRRGLLAFTGLDALQSWDPTARPVPVSGADAARAALDDGCEADPLDYALRLAQQQLDNAFGAGEVQVTIARDRLQMHSARIGRVKITAALEQMPRVLALVPAGIEVLAEG